MAISLLENIVNGVHELLLHIIGREWVMEIYIPGSLNNLLHSGAKPRLRYDLIS